MMRPLATLGNVNVDLILGPLAPWPVPGSEVLCPEEDLRVGGAAGNAALAWQAMGLPFQCVASTGSDPFGDWLRAGLGAAVCGVGDGRGAWPQDRGQGFVNEERKGWAGLRAGALARMGAFALALACVSGVLMLAGASPLAAFGEILGGAAGSASDAGYVVRAWIPLLLAAAGLVVTFAAGLWNIGIEGQIMMGAVLATAALRVLEKQAVPPAAAMALCLLAGVAGGVFWAVFAGALKTHGGVHEIFGGLGLNFVASALTLWLIVEALKCSPWP